MTLSAKGRKHEQAARAIADGVTPIAGSDPALALQYAQLHATLALLESSKQCEEHLFRLTVGRSA